MSKKILLTNAALWAAYDGLTSIYLTAFALALGATNLQIGLLGALPWIASIITQIPGAELVQHYSRKKLYVIFCLTGRLFWIPILLSPYFFQKPILAITIFYLIARLAETIADPAYTTMLADIVPEKHRGQFISKRYRIIATFGMIAMSLGGLWLKQYPKDSPHGFATMFAFGVVLAILATLIMSRIKEPKYKDHCHHTVKEFFTLEGQMKTFVIFGVVFNFAFMLASPFFAVYMLKNLEMTYFQYGLASSIAILAQIITSINVGKLTDKYGDKPIAILGHLGTAIVPLVFLAVTKENIWMIFIAQIVSGIVWAAADISRFNLLLGIVDSRKRAIQIAEYNLYAAMTLAIAPIIGGWLTEHATLILTGIPLIFVISSILRFLSALLLFRIKEPRAKKEYPLVYVFREAIHFHANRGLVNGMHVVKRITNNLFPK